MNIRPLPGNIFAVLQLGERVTAGGIVLRDDNGKDEGIRPRWAQIWKVADDVTDVRPGQWALCEHGRWTMRIRIKDDDGKEFEFVKLDPNGIMCVQDEAPTDTILGTLSGFSSDSARPEDFGAR